MNVRGQEDERVAVRERRAEADRAATERAAAEREADRTETLSRHRREPGLAPEPTPRPEPVTEPEPVGPRPRASLLATLALIVGVAAALFVLTGVLAGYGVALGAVAVLLAVGGFSATSRRHVAGKSDAIVGLALGLGAIVLGVLVLTDSLTWLTTASDKVGQFREWLDTQTVDRF